MEQYSMFSKELEEQIASTVVTIVNRTIDENKLKGGKRYYKKQDFCKEIGISYGTLQKWLIKGLQVIHVESITMIDMQDAEKFLQAHKI